MASEPEALSAPTSGLTTLPAKCEAPAGGVRDGVEYFVQRMFATHPRWGLLALRAAAPRVVAGLAESMGLEVVETAARDAVLAERQGECFLVQLAGHDWSLLLGSELEIRRPSVVGEAAAAVSRRLGVPVVAFAYEDTGGGSIAARFEHGEEVERARSRRSWQRFFRQQELFVPFSGVHGDEGRTQLVVEAVDRDAFDYLAFLAADTERRTDRVRLDRELLDAVLAEQTEAVEALLRSGADPDVSGPHGQTALHAAIQSAADRIVSALLSAGADPDRPDEDGFTAREAAASPFVPESIRSRLAEADGD